MSGQAPLAACREGEPAASTAGPLWLSIGYSLSPSPGGNTSCFHEAGQGHKIWWQMWCFWLPVVAKGLVPAPGLDLVNIDSLVPPTFCNFSAYFYAGRKKSNNSNCSVLSLVSSTTRASSSPTTPSETAAGKHLSPWRRQTSRDSGRDLQCSLNSGQDLFSLWMSNLRLVLVILGAWVARDITSVRVSWETSLELPMNNLFGLTTTNRHLIICRTWSSALSHSLPLSTLWTSATLLCCKTRGGRQQTYGCNFSILSQSMHSISNHHVKYHRHWNSFHHHQSIWMPNGLTCISLTFML